MIPDSDRLTGRVHLLPPTSGAEQEVLPADPRRLSIAFSGVGIAGGIVVRVYSLGETFLPLAIPTDDTLEVWYARHGPLVQGRWTIVGPMAGPRIPVYELLYTGD